MTYVPGPGAAGEGRDTGRVDQNAAKSALTDLAWAIENCTVLGLHQIGEALDDPMWVA